MNRKSVLVRCDASNRIGYGHLVRCLALAEELRDRHNAQVTFAVREDAAALARISAHGFAALAPELNRPFYYAAWLAELVTMVRPEAMILDVRDDLSLELVARVRGLGIFIVLLDDPHERRLAADLVFYPPVPQLGAFHWDDFTGAVYSGWQWVVLRRQFADLPPRNLNTVPRLLVTMGGSDPAGLTLKTISALASSEADFRATVVIGPGFIARDELHRILATAGHPMEVIENVDDMATVMGQFDLAVAAFGVTAYELAAVGVPSILIGLTEDHVSSATAFVEAGISCSLGLHSTLRPERLRKCCEQLHAATRERLDMAAKARQLLDGRGVERIAKLVMSGLSR